MDEKDQQEKQAAIDAAIVYNESLLSNTSRFIPTEEELNVYKDLLNADGSGMMGYITIPSIDCKLAIYHTVDASVLQVGAGHLEGSSLPVGGKSTHTVLSGHRGLPSAKLFTDLDQLKEGDIFYLHVYGEVLTYEVDQIAIVEPNDYGLLQIEEGKDLCTLFTCTPYGVNSHRLLVRGHRVAYHGEEDETSTMSDNMLQSVKDYYMLYALTAVAISVLAALGIRIIRNRKSEKRSGREKK